MKRRLLALLLAVLTLTMLTAAAFAEDTEVLGVYNVTGPLTVTNGTKGHLRQPAPSPGNSEETFYKIPGNKAASILQLRHSSYIIILQILGVV